MRTGGGPHRNELPAIGTRPQVGMVLGEVAGPSRGKQSHEPKSHGEAENPDNDDQFRYAHDRAPPPRLERV
jgi:hypothetical protein